MTEDDDEKVVQLAMHRPADQLSAMYEQFFEMLGQAISECFKTGSEGRLMLNGMSKKTQKPMIVEVTIKEAGADSQAFHDMLMRASKDKIKVSQTELDPT